MRRRILACLMLVMATISTYGVLALPKNAQPSFIYLDGDRITVRDLLLKEAMPHQAKKKGHYARHWHVNDSKGAKWSGYLGDVSLDLPVLEENKLPEEQWRAKLLPGSTFRAFLKTVNDNLSGQARTGSPLAVEVDDDGNMVMTAYGYGDNVYGEMQKVHDAVDAQLRRDYASPFRAVYQGYITWRLSDDGKSGAPVLVPDYYNIALLADIFSGIYPDFAHHFKSRAEALAVPFEDLLVDFVQSIFTRKTGEDRSASLITPEKVLENMAGNGDSKALLWLSIARGFGSPLLDRDLVLILRPNGALIGREIYEGEPGQGSHIVLGDKNFRLVSLDSPRYAPAGVISLDEYRDLANGRWKYQIIPSPG